MNLTLNAYAMDQQEAAAQGREDQRRDFLDLNLTDPVEELCLEATFPEGFAFTNPRLDWDACFASSSNGLERTEAIAFVSP